AGPSLSHRRSSAGFASPPRDCTMSSEQVLPDDVATTDRRGGGDRRRPTDRRKRNIPVAGERRTGQDPRHQGERRRQVDPTTCERDYKDDEIEFMKAMDQYKRANRRPFPTWSEVLEVLHALGYRKVEAAGPLPGHQPPGARAASANGGLR